MADLTSCRLVLEIRKMSSPTLTENLYSFSPGCGKVMAEPPETEVGREEPEMAWSTDALLEWLSPSGKGD